MTTIPDIQKNSLEKGEIPGSNYFELIIALLFFTMSYFLGDYFLDLPDLLTGYSLIVTVLELPYFVSSTIKSDKYNWFFSSRTLTLLIPIFLAIIGLFIPNQILTYFIIGLGIFLIFWRITKKHSLSFSLFLFSAIFTVFIYILFYSQGYHSPFFLQKVIGGTANIDTLFHSSISNSIINHGIPSTGLDGVLYFNYHWGSHFIIGGLSQWSTLDVLTFYNILYPAIFIPLFFRATLYLFNSVAKKYETGFRSLIFIISLLLVIYSIKLLPFKGAHPFLSESYCIALTYSLIFISQIIDKNYKKITSSHLFSIYSFGILFFVLITKISTGFIVVTSILYLLVRTNSSKKRNFFCILFYLLLISLAYYLVFPKARVASEVSYFSRYLNFWSNSYSFFTYSLGLIIPPILLLLLVKNDTPKRVIQQLKKGDFVDIEIIFVSTLLAITGGLYVSVRASDVFYFTSNQIFFLLPLIMLIAVKGWNYLPINSNIRVVTLFVIVIGSIISRPDSLSSFISDYNSRKTLVDSKEMKNELVDYLVNLNDLDNKGGYCLFIESDEDWYHSIIKDRPLASSFIVPAISGVPMIAGITKTEIESDYNYYSLYYYRSKGYKTVNNVEKAQQRARTLGFKKMIHLKSAGGKLEEVIFEID